MSPSRSHRVCARTFALLIVALATAGIGHAQTAPLKSGIDRANVDASVRPQDDFFRHVNGTWLKTAPMPADKARIGAFVSLREQSESEVLAIVEAAVRAPDGIDARRIGDLYRSFMDEAAVAKAGLGPLRGELAAIDAIGSTGELAAAMGKLADGVVVGSALVAAHHEHGVAGAAELTRSLRAAL